MVAGMPFFTPHRMHLLLTNRGLLYRIQNQFSYIPHLRSSQSSSTTSPSLPEHTRTPKRTTSYAPPPPWFTTPPCTSIGHLFLGISTLDWEWVGTVGRAEERAKRGGQTRVGGGGQCVFRAGGYLMSLSPFYLVASVHCDG